MSGQSIETTQSRALTVAQINANQGQGRLSRHGEVRAHEGGSRIIDLSFASEAPVDRWFGTEVLEVTSAAMRLDRMRNGAPLLMEHDRHRQIGVVESVTIGADRVARARVRFSRSAEAEAVLQDVIDGIRSGVSVSYNIRETREELRAGQPPIVRVIDWEPYEVSIVSIPADATVGIGRSASQTVPAAPQSRSLAPARVGPAADVRTVIAELMEDARTAAPFHERRTGPDSSDVRLIPQNTARVRYLRLTDALPEIAEVPQMQARAAHAASQAAPAAQGGNQARNLQSALGGRPGAALTLGGAAAGNARVFEAGARMIVLPSQDDPGPYFISAGAGEQVMAVGDADAVFSVIAPAVMTEQTVEHSDFADMGTIATRAEIGRANLRLFGCTTTVTRRAGRMVGDGTIAVEFASAIAAGIGDVIDRVLLTALEAAGLAEVAPLDANGLMPAVIAQRGLRFRDIRGMIGTSGAGRPVEGQLYLGGFPSEVTNQCSAAIYGAFDRAGVAISNEIGVTAHRFNTRGDLQVTAWIGAAALIPEASYFWAVPGTLPVEGE